MKIRQAGDGNWKDRRAFRRQLAVRVVCPEHEVIYLLLGRTRGFRALEAGRARLARPVLIRSEITRESAPLSFGAIHFGDHHVNGGRAAIQGGEAEAVLRR